MVYHSSVCVSLLTGIFAVYLLIFQKQETEFQHVAEEEPELFDEAFELDGPSEQNSQENGRGWRRQTPRASNPTRLSTSVLNQITEEEGEWVKTDIT